MAPRRAAPSRTGTGREELSFLADLIGGEEVGSDAGSAAAKMNLNLFGEDEGDAAGGGGGGETQSQVRQPTRGAEPNGLVRSLELITCCRTQMITIDVGRTATSHVADVMASMSLDGGGGSGAAGGRATPPIGGGDDDDDLLDLLDAAE